MKKVLVMVALVMVSVIVYAFNDRVEAKQGKKEVTGNNGEVVVMNKEMFLKDVFDYEKSKEWKYKGDKPAIIDLYADWCGPCRQTAPIMKELAKEYAGKIVIYKVNVDKQKELAALFNATSIPSVSYTHLDVYKRQLSVSSVAKRITGCGPVTPVISPCSVFMRMLTENRQNTAQTILL